MALSTGPVARHAAETDNWRTGSAEGTLLRVDEEQGIYRGEVLAIMGALADIYADTSVILAILGEGADDDGEEADS